MLNLSFSIYSNRSRNFLDAFKNIGVLIVSCLKLFYLKMKVFLSAVTFYPIESLCREGEVYIGSFR